MTSIAQKRIDKHQPQLTPIEWAYLAGIIDGEGTISILRVKKKALPGFRKTDHYLIQPSLTVSNTHEGLLTWLGEKIGTKVQTRHRPQIIGQNHLKRIPQTCYQVLLAGYQVYNVVRAIEPYLIVKKEQALLVMQFIESRLQQAENHYNAQYTEEQIQIWLKVRALNRYESRPYPIEADLTVPCTTSLQAQEISSLTAS